ncbi:MAG TPA: glycosyltransferase family 39 protein [Polyangiaceae bacterium]|nr:glycosyltransferase family 39 protein [Polyangiaceae bacterium]
MVPSLPASRKVWSVPTIVFGLLLVCYATLVWVYGRSPEIAEDWHGWRQADTQVIARHFAEPGSSLFLPRIDWGGSKAGYVEAELQLYPWVVAWFLRLFGDAEWPGQFVSLVCTLAAVAVLQRGFARNFGPLAASLGALALLSSRSIAYTATALQPEAMCLLFYAIAWTQFQRYEETRGRAHLIWFAVAGVLAMLVKPTAAQIGISSFLLLALRSRRHLAKPDPWLAWAGMLAVFGAYLLVARSVYEQYGNSFGVLFGSTSKIPKLEHLARLESIKGAAMQSVIWGLGPVGALALLVLTVRRRVDAVLIALLAGNIAWTLLAIRQTSGIAGTHYHVLMSVVTAYATALAVHTLPARGVLRVGAAVAVAATLVLVLRQRSHLRMAMAPNVSAAAQTLSRYAHPGELVVVRSMSPARSQQWGVAVNYQDPRIHFLSHTHGWVLPFDEHSPTTLAQAVAEGASYYVEIERAPDLGPFDTWLAEHATQLGANSYGGRLYALKPRLVSGL